MATLVRDEVCDPLIRLFRLWWKTLSAYVVSKTLAERSVSKWTNENGCREQLTSKIP